MNENAVITAWGEGQASQDIAPTGLMKLDLLGLDTVSVVSECVRVASERHKRDVWQEVNPLAMDYTDLDVLKEFAGGNGFGLHQLNNADQSLAQFMRKLKPKSVFDVTAAVAMYRPGSMEFLDEYVARANGVSEPESVHPVYDEILKETHGIIVYQEQIMHVLHKLGGIPLREAYGTIKDIGKSRSAFLSGAVASGVSREVAERVFGLIEKFAGYGFAKSHAASYAVLSWVTAYLRAKYPSEFWLCWLNATDNATVAKGKGGAGDRKVVQMMRCAARSGI